MGFTYPLFLLAGLAVAIPLVIHLFDLRRYKTVLFPSTRFLQEVALKSRRQRTVRQRLLLLLRSLFLLALVLAFAQPYWRGSDARPARRLTIVYIDNGPASGARKDGRSLLDRTTAAARRLLATQGGPVYLLTAAGPASYSPLPQAAADAALAALRPAPARLKPAAVWAAAQGLLATARADGADLWWFSDFRRSAFDARPGADLSRRLTLHAVVQEDAAPRNNYIDTAEVLPALEAGGETRLVVRTRTIGDAPATPLATQLVVGGQVRSAASGAFGTDGTRTDTLAFTGNGATWQPVLLTVDDGTGAAFDDTFRLAVRPVRPLPVLVLQEGAPNPYLRAALAASGRFAVSEASVETPPADLRPFSLVVLSGTTELGDAPAAALKAAYNRGTPLAVFPGRASDPARLERALRLFVDVRVTGIDTALQAASSLQGEAPVVRDLFERIPPNVQLPTAAWHYRVQAGFAANGQSLLAFRSGDPLLARYQNGRGTLYLLTSGADLASGNFATSYFFPPLLYGAATEGAGAAAVAQTAGRETPVFLPQRPDAGNRDAVAHLLAPGVDAVPPQRAAGSGLEVYPGAVMPQPGFYTLTAPGADSMVVALNADRAESLPDRWPLDELKRAWKGPEAQWLAPGNVAAAARNASGSGASWPLWKISGILALLLLAAETYVLATPPRPAGAPSPAA